MAELNFRDMDDDSIVQLLNQSAKDSSEEGLPDDFLHSFDYVEEREALDKRVGELIVDRFAELEDDTNLSGNEAYVVSLKEIGLTHQAIAYKMRLISDATKSTVDEYSRRARQKFLQAKQTVDNLESVYGGTDDE
ncbi:hypothetical protein [Haloferax sp. Atlit-4N]|uniref:hypothetical protein n=1 Tax=Haloferax sp. Atlit-4N TaxID=2077206 RepID=UPI0011C067A2|nr:hypothetical protein [Haloferax sp. Atlit-4N]